MRIESIPPKELLNKYIHIREKAAAPDNVSAADEAELTKEAKAFSTALKAAKEALESQPSERKARIKEVAQQIEEGTYLVPGEKVAEKMLGKNGPEI